MQHLLPIGLAKSVNLVTLSVTKLFRTLLLASGLLLVFSMQANAQEPEVIQNWQRLEEADFYFDVSYTVVKCSASSNAQVLLNAFNEGGNVDSIGFSLELSDDKGNTASVEIEKFNISFGQMFIASCESDDHSNLKFDVPDGMDAATLQIEITYNK